MVTVAKVLNVLKDKYYITDWKMKQYVEGDLKWKSPIVTNSVVSVTDETYGNKSYLYFTTKDKEVAVAFAKTIIDIGGKPEFKWCPDDPKSFELKVTHFKGWHWWE